MIREIARSMGAGPIEVWPDAARVLAEACPKGFLALTNVLEDESAESVPFGEISLTLDSTPYGPCWRGSARPSATSRRSTRRAIRCCARGRSFTRT
jgi:hypothetical protein